MQVTDLLHKRLSQLSLKPWQWFIVIWTISLLVSFFAAQLFKISVFAIL